MALDRSLRGFGGAPTHALTDNERTVSVDHVPTDHNLRAAYGSFAELELACEAFCEKINTREHRVTRRAPVVMLAQERERLHPLPAVAHTLCFGETRRVSRQATVSVGGALYSVPSALVDERKQRSSRSVRARRHG